MLLTRLSYVGMLFGALVPKSPDVVVIDRATRRAVALKEVMKKERILFATPQDAILLMKLPEDVPPVVIVSESPTDPIRSIGTSDDCRYYLMEIHRSSSDTYSAARR